MPYVRCHDDSGGPDVPLELVLHHLAAPVLVLGPDQLVREANPAAAALLGRDQDGLLGCALADLVGSCHAPAVEREWARLAAGADTAVLGSEHVAYDLSALRPDGRFGGVVVALRAVAPSSDDLLDRAMDSAPLCLVAFDRHGLVTYAGGSGFAVLSVDPADTVGQNVLAPYERSAPFEVALRRCLGGEPVDTVLPYGGRVWDLHYRPVLDAAGQVTGGLCLAHDITDWLAPGASGRVSTARSTAVVAPQDQLAVEADLREALALGQLGVDYQPVVQVQDGRPTGAEALMRWVHPTRGVLRPAQFLALAERTGLVLALGERVLRQACHAAAGWNRDLPDAGLQVAVNLSARQLWQPGLAALVREALLVAECQPSWLVLEVSERTVTDDQDVAAGALRSLAALGVGLALDDAGTGTSSSASLRRFPFDLLKVDGSFVAGLGRQDDRGAVVASLISSARSLGVRCLAEGVETPEQLAVLQELDCDFAQGHLFSRPLPSALVTGWLGQAVAGSGDGRALRPPAQRTTSGAAAGGAAAGDPATGAAATDGGAAVERALELHGLGDSLHTVAARLNLEGLRTAHGRRWHHTSVARLVAASHFPGLAL